MKLLHSKTSSSPISERPLLDERSPVSFKLSVPEAAAFLGCSKSFLDKKRLDGSGPLFMKVGRKILYDRSDLEEWVTSTKRRRTIDWGQIHASILAR